MQKFAATNVSSAPKYEHLPRLVSQVHMMAGQNHHVYYRLARLTGAFKGNPNFQGILNWIIQILHYYCRKQHKNIENSRIIEQNFAISLSALLSAYCDLRFLRLPQRQSIFSSWTQFWTSQVIIRAVYSLIFYFENRFL